ncbi:MAG: hypothetical protein ACRD5Z_21715, partial [Bryobacteraceae bacterium]
LLGLEGVERQALVHLLRGLKSEVRWKMGRTPLAVFGCAGETANAGLIQHRPRDAAEAVFHPGLHRACHLTATLFSKSLRFRSLTIRGGRNIHPEKERRLCP